jgi:hypothetical protein
MKPMIKIKYTILYLAILTLSLSSMKMNASAFSEGSVSFDIVAGAGQAFNKNYTVLGVGIGYYVAQGLEVGIDIEHWFSSEPSITKVSPQIKFVFSELGDIKPYAGGFYRETFIDNQSEEGSFGFRGGAFFSSSNGMNIGAGIVYEEYLDCDKVVECSTTYPEVRFSLNF